MPAAVRALVRVGLDGVAGHLAGGIDAWIAAGHPAGHIPQLTPAELAARLGNGGDLRVLDVRNDSEWRDGHVPAAQNIMAGYLLDRLGEVKDGGRPLAVVCRSGHRSTVAASVLARAGLGEVYNVTGGMNAWRGAGLPIETA